MNIEEMTMDDIEKRSLEIEDEIKVEGADLDSLEDEVNKLEERKLEITKQAEERKKELEEIKGLEIEPIEKEEVKNNMEIKELRNTKEYINAFADFVKTGNDVEIRKVMTSNGTPLENDTLFPVPELVENKIRTAWENDQIMRRINRTFFKGNVKVGFEISGTDAVIHVEGGEAIEDEVLKLGTVTIIPQSIKKMIHITDELYDMGGQEFLDYIYDELAYRIVKKASGVVIASILDNPTISSATAPAVASITQELNASTIVNAEALLNDEANEVVAIMNRATWGALRSLQLSSGTNVGDVFDGKDVVFTSELPSYDNATSGQAYMIVGDLRGVTANFPRGDEVTFKFDDLSEAEADLIKVVGRLYAGIEVTEVNYFTQVKKA